MTSEPVDQRELVITRRLGAPRSVVWRTFEDPLLLARWWGPENFTTTITAFEFRTGGEWHVTMRSPEGTERFVRYLFLEIVAPERIVYRPLRPADAVLRGKLPPTYVATLTFESLGEGETMFTMRAEFESAADLVFATEAGFAEGTRQAINKLERQFASQ